MTAAIPRSPEWAYNWRCIHEQHKMTGLGCTDRWSFPSDTRRALHIKSRTHPYTKQSVIPACVVVKWETPTDLVVLPKQ